MRLDFDGEKPIYLQLAEVLEDNVLRGIYAEETQTPSTTELSVSLKINPATAGKALNTLVDEGILYKKRGVGMFVATGAKEMILKKRKAEFYSKFVIDLLEEARKLNISIEDIISMLKRGQTE